MSHKQLQGGGGAELEEQHGNGEPSYGSPRNPLSPLANQNARPRSPPSALSRVASNGTSSPGVEVIHKPSPKPKKHSPRRKRNGSSKGISSGGSTSVSCNKDEKGESDRGSGGGAGSVGGQGSSGSIFGLKHPPPSSSDYACNYSMYGDDHLCGNGNGGGSNSGRDSGNSGSGSSLDAAPAHGPRRRGKRVKNKKTTKTKKKLEAAVATARNRSKSTQDRHQSHQNQCQRKQQKQKQKQQRQQKQQQHYQQPCRVDAGADSDSFATGADNSTVTDMSESMVADSADIQHFLRTAPEDELKRKAVVDAQRRIKVWSEYR